MTPASALRRREVGIGLIEALVALLVLALGMLACMALQSRLRVGADLSRQRAEAVALALRQTETVRSFGSAAAFDTLLSIQLAVDAAALGSNAAYAVTRTLVERESPLPGVGAALKDLRVDVRWLDRQGEPQALALRSMIARAEPALGAIATRPRADATTSALPGRHAGVPWPAHDLGDGRSAWRPLLGGTLVYVFDNASGAVLLRCSGVDPAAELGSATLASASCAAVTAYLVSGFVRASLGPQPDALAANDPTPGEIALRVDFDNTPPPPQAQGSTAQLSAAHWPSVDAAAGRSIGSGPAAFTPALCHAQALQAVRYATPLPAGSGSSRAWVSASVPQALQNLTPTSVAPWVGVSAGDAATLIIDPRATGERYLAYSCLVPALDLDLAAATPAAYSARITLWPVAGWGLGATPDTLRVCRYSADANGNGAIFVADGPRVVRIDNAEHPYAYLNAQASLAQQNFLLLRGDLACPAPQDGHYTAATTVAHQP